MNRYISTKTRNELLTSPWSKQCANTPIKAAPGCKGYRCPMWIGNGGFFDESGYEIDHIIEVKHGGQSELSNLQMLCPCCHSVKTKRCAKQNWMYTSIEIDTGLSNMELS